ncbi:hypothetical protein HDV63DRAFT_369310 [Trichoderma sp. SZMC 28014]
MLYSISASMVTRTVGCRYGGLELMQAVVVASHDDKAQPSMSSSWSSLRTHRRYQLQHSVLENGQIADVCRRAGVEEHLGKPAARIALPEMQTPSPPVLLGPSPRRHHQRPSASAPHILSLPPLRIWSTGAANPTAWSQVCRRAESRAHGTM